MQAYAEDLGLDDKLLRVHQHPNNVWAVYGHHECLIRLKRRAEAALVEKVVASPVGGCWKPELRCRLCD